MRKFIAKGISITSEHDIDDMSLWKIQLENMIGEMRVKQERDAERIQAHSMQIKKLTAEKEDMETDYKGRRKNIEDLEISLQRLSKGELKWG